MKIMLKFQNYESQYKYKDPFHFLLLMREIRIIFSWIKTFCFEIRLFFIFKSTEIHVVYLMHTCKTFTTLIDMRNIWSNLLRFFPCHHYNFSVYYHISICFVRSTFNWDKWPQFCSIVISFYIWFMNANYDSCFRRKRSLLSQRNTIF